MIPLLLITIFGTIQAATFYHARNVARSAASACAERARGYDATLADARASAQRVVDQATGLTAVRIEASQHGLTVSCRVTGTAPVLVAVGNTTIQQSAQLPKERV